jgi:hypothetical protein
MKLNRYICFMLITAVLIACHKDDDKRSSDYFILNSMLHSGVTSGIISGYSYPSKNLTDPLLVLKTKFSFEYQNMFLEDSYIYTTSQTNQLQKLKADDMTPVKTVLSFPTGQIELMDVGPA